MTVQSDLAGDDLLGQARPRQLAPSNETGRCHGESNYIRLTKLRIGRCRSIHSNEVVIEVPGASGKVFGCLD